MKDLTIKFVDFWPSFDVRNNKFVSALSDKFNVRVLDDDSDARPEMLFYSVYGTEHYNYPDCIKIYYTGENDVPDFNECDYALSFHQIDFDGRHLRYPLFMTYEVDRALVPPILTDKAALKRGFCSLLMRNSQNCARERLDIIDAVNEYKSVAFGGPYRNNIGEQVPIDGKIDFIVNYKFNLALENSSIPGYVTEKIVESFAAPTVPIYWGAPDIDDDFNPESFINVANYPSLSAFITDLKDIDNDDNRYLKMLRAPRLKERKELEFDHRLSKFLCRIATHMTMKRPMQAWQKGIYRRNHIMRCALSRPRLLNLTARLLKIKGEMFD
ncbi:MAG: glycosyltransferase family 10 [Prevotella sp.]|nr:glycosyltransferase family 10 [Bacteroides sp.]MCM1366060.1 glycosyltransferase family 10 [Prevotella sp.]MCM1436545.1 glycosyltransferase family 10 [Prevotella sp.]